MYSVVESYSFDPEMSVTLFPDDTDGTQATAYARKRFEECMASERDAQNELEEDERFLEEGKCKFDEKTGSGVMVWTPLAVDNLCQGCQNLTPNYWYIDVIKPKVVKATERSA